jgi:hypothetical protein
MPLADFTLVFSCAEIVDSSWAVLRRAANVDEHGRSNPLVVARYDAKNGCVGTVTIAGANDLQRLPEDQRQLKTIRITTPFRLQGSRHGEQPDIVRWHGEDYVLLDVEDYTGFGPGFGNFLAQRLENSLPFPYPSR